jgi:hypothetical protein
MTLPIFKASSLALVLIIAGVTSANSEDEIWPHEAKNHLGEIAMVCGTIAGVRRERQTYHPEFKQQTAAPSNLSLLSEHTILYFEKLPPHHEFMAIFEDTLRREFPDQPESLVNQKACLYGKILKYRSKQAIVIVRPDQLAVEHTGKGGK